VTVTLASLLMLLGAALATVVGILLIALSNRVSQDFRSNAADSGASRSDIDGLATGIQATMITGGILTLVLAVAVVLLAIGVFRRSNAARITALVLVIASLFCGVGGAGVTSAARSATDLSLQDTDAQTAENLGQALGDSIPAWFVGLTIGLSCVQVLAYLAVVVLLLLPASNAYFRRASTQQPTPPAPSAPPPMAPPPTAPPPSGSPTQPPAAPPRFPDDQPGGPTM
jgi:hypothetical protein